MIVMDENSREQIKDTFWTMHQIEYEIEEIEVIPEQPEEPEEPEPEEPTDPTVPEEPEEPPSPSSSIFYISRSAVNPLRNWRKNIISPPTSGIF